MTKQPVSAHTLDTMVTYYRERAAEYDEWFYRRGRHDGGAEMTARWFAEVDEVIAALEACALAGDVLELAAGTGIWTQRLAQRTRTVTAVDASPEMLALNRARVAGDRVCYVLTDLFTWRPTRAYDAVFCGFWLSHVPDERLDAFLDKVRTALRPEGAFFLVDSRREPASPLADREGRRDAEAQLVTRQLNDGRTFRIVKNFYDPAALTARCAAAGLAVHVRETPTYFIHGAGTRA